MKKEIIAILLLIALVLIFFAKVIISNEYFSGLDLVNAFYPWKDFLVHSVKSGELPLWNPYTFSGNPFIGNFQACTFYPFDLLFFFASIPAAFRINFLFHIFLSGGLMYLLTRYLKLNRTASFFSASAFMFSGFLFVRLSAGHSTMINGYAWIPLIFYLFLKGVESKKSIYLVFLALVLAIQFLCGHPQVPYYTLLSLFLFLLGQTIYTWKNNKGNAQSKFETYRPLLLYCGAVALAILLAAIQIFPAWQLAQFSATRAGGVQYIPATVASFSWRYLSLFFSPLLYGSTLDNTFWGGEEGFIETSGYLGILPILLLLFAFYRTWRSKPTVLFSIVWLFSILLAFGKHTPLYWLFYHMLPGFNLFRCPARWLIIFTFSTAILSGIGLHQLIEHLHEKKAILRFMVFLAIVGAIIALIIVMFVFNKNHMVQFLYHQEIARLHDFYGPQAPISQIVSMIPEDAMANRLSMIINTLIKGFGLFLVSLSVFYIYWRRKTSSIFLLCFPIILLIVDLWSFDILFITTEKGDKFFAEYYQDSPEVQFLKSDKNYYRILCLDQALSWMHTSEFGPTAEFRPNRLMLRQIFDTRGYDPVTLRSYTEYINKMLGNPIRSYQGGLLYIPSVRNCNWNMLSLLNVKYVIAVNDLDIPNLELVFSDQLKIYRNRTVLPRGFFVRQEKVIPDLNQRLIELANPTFAPLSYVVLTKPYEGRITTMLNTGTEPSNANISVNITHYSPNRIELTTNPDSAGYLVLSEIDYPGWHVYVDGKEKPVLAADQIFRAVYLDTGKHHVEFIFAPKGFRWGLIISLVSLIASVCFLLIKLGYKNLNRKVR